MTKANRYLELRRHLEGVLRDESDPIALMATVACELRLAFEDFHWVGFYRVVAPGLLKIGPYQGGHGCLTIAFDRGVCGKCAREAATQIVEDVTQVPEHIACSSSTRSEIVVPVFDAERRLRAVLDIDSDRPGQFDAVDAEQLEAIAGCLREAAWGPAV